MLSSSYQPKLRAEINPYLISKQSERFSISASAEDAVSERSERAQAAKCQEQGGRGRTATQPRQRHAEQSPAAPEEPQAATATRVAAENQTDTINNLILTYTLN